MFFILFVGLIFVLAGFRVANQYQRGVVFRLGKLQGIRGPGLYWLIPANRMAKKWSISGR